MNVGATIAIVLLAAGVSRASLISYEPFDYPEGQPINGLAGGTGWRLGGWGPSPGTVASVVSPGLSAPGSISQVGRSMLLSAGSNVGVSRSTAAHFDVPAPSDYWFSYIQQRNPGGQGDLEFSIGGFGVVVSYESGVFGLADIAGGFTPSPVPPLTSDPMLIVVHVAPQGALHSFVDLFINPASGPINPIVSSPFPTSLFGATSSITFEGNLSSDVRIDELRIGTTFLDVAVPSPATPVIALLGLLATGRRRRRRAAPIDHFPCHRPRR